MSASIAQVTHDALALSEAERALLAETLLRSLDAQEEATVEETWEAEIARRRERFLAGTSQATPAEDVFREMRARREQ